MNENNKDEKKNNYVTTFYYRRILPNQSQTYLLSLTITFRSEKWTFVPTENERKMKCLLWRNIWKLIDQYKFNKVFINK